MASNFFGQIFRITTWGESHGPAMGVVIDGCPAGLALTEEDLQVALEQRRPGKNAYVSPRQEPDEAKIYSGVFQGVTTGAPISIIILNQDVQSKPYAQHETLLRPGHAQLTYLEKYGHYDHRGGGRASARETVCRVAAGAVAKKLLARYGIDIIAYLSQLGDHVCRFEEGDEEAWTVAMIQHHLKSSELFCPYQEDEKKYQKILTQLIQEGDSCGGVVAFRIEGLPIGLGDPVYEKLEANLAKAMLSIPASKGFEVGEGFQAALMRGSVHNDPIIHDQHQFKTQTNHAGGILGGIATGMPIFGRVAFKPTSSIRTVQSTCDVEGHARTFELAPGSRHDPCVAIRAVPVVESMCALVCADAWLMNQVARCIP